MQSIDLPSKSLSLPLSGLVLLFLIGLLSAPFSQAQDDQQRSSRLITHPESVTALPSQNKRWALLIGVDRYEDSNIGPLRGAANDANSLKDVLIKYSGFPQDQVIVLSTNEPPERQPTRKNILKRLSNLAGLVPRDGLLLISFAGHGIDRNGRAFLIPSDATLTEDLGLLEETAVSVNHVKQRIKDTGVQQVMILLDACRAYPTGRSDSPNLLTPAFTNAFSFDTRNHEVVAFAVLYATAVGSRAYEYGEKHQGYFSWAIAQALSGAAANDRGEITLRALVKYLEDRVPKLVALDYGAKVIQKPFAEIEGYRADELVLSVSTPQPKVTSPNSQASPNNRVGPAEPGTSNQSQPTSTTMQARQPAKVLLNVTLKQAGGVAVYDAEIDGVFLELLSNSGVECVDISSFDIKTRTRSLSVIEGLRGGYAMISKYELIIDAELVINDRLPSGADGMFIANITGLLRVFDSNIGRAVITKNLSLRGFGLNRGQAITNAKRNVREGLTDEILAKIAEYSK